MVEKRKLQMAKVEGGTTTVWYEEGENPYVTSDKWRGLENESDNYKSKMKVGKCLLQVSNKNDRKTSVCHNLVS